ncbi:MAG: hypothetical protein JWN27_3191 [Candidatus Eremiobacteraeota bacterium]|nr:hypothetical protein [Candidatus Eremiobacteraeota bacterium]
MKTITALALAAAFVAVTPLCATATARANACALIGPADVVASTGGPPTGPVRPHAYPNDPASECYILTSKGTIKAALFPVEGARQMSSIRAGYGALETVHGIGDEAVYSKRYATLAIRRGKSTLMLSLASPDDAQNRRIVLALGKRVARKLR